MAIEASKYYICIAKVVMQHTKEVAFKNGKVYYAKFDGSLIDEQDSKHAISDIFAKDHFVEMTEVVKRFVEKRSEISKNI